MVEGPNNGRRGSASSVGYLGQGSEQEVMSSGKTRWETLPWRGQLTIRNHSLALTPHNIVERTTPLAELIPRNNIPATLPLVSECKQKHMQGGAHGPRKRKNGGWVKYWSESLGVMGGTPWPVGPNSGT